MPKWHALGNPGGVSLDEVYVDLDSIGQEGAYRTAVFLTVYEKPRSNANNIATDRHTQKTAFDCGKRAFSLISTVGYLDGKQVGSSPLNENWRNDFKPLPQDHFSQRSLDVVCNAHLASSPKLAAAQPNFSRVNPTLALPGQNGPGGTEVGTVKLEGGSTAKLDENADLGSSAGNRAVQITLKPQAWQLRRLEFTQAVTALHQNSNDPKAREVIERVLVEYEQKPLGRTPIEAMDILGLFYLPKEGARKVMTTIVMEVALGWFDSLQWASESGKAEIINNEKLFGRAFLLGGGKQHVDGWSTLIRDDPQLATKIVEDGLRLAVLHQKSSDITYDRKWPTAYGLERTIAAMNGKPDPEPITVPRISADAAWKEVMAKVRTYYLPSTDGEKTARTGWIDSLSNPRPETDSMKSAGGFGANLLLTTNEADFVKSWSQTQDAPVLKVDHTVSRGKPITAMILFSGCKANSEGKCNVTAQYKISSPDGTTSETASAPVWQKDPPPDGLVLLGDVRLRTVIEKDEPLGTYQVTATVVDNVSGIILKLRSTFTAVN